MWTEKDDALFAELKFKDFVAAFAFMSEVSVLAEYMNHHPEWSNVWNKVNIKLTTHSVGNKITQNDRVMAEKIEAIYTKYNS